MTKYMIEKKKIVKNIWIASMCLFIIFTTTSLMAKNYKTIRYVAETKRVPIKWNHKTGKVEASISVGRFRYFNDKGKELETYINYLIVWHDYRPITTDIIDGRCQEVTLKDLIEWQEYRPIIADVIDGHCPEIILKDLNEDGEKEIIIFYHAGTHIHYWRIYKKGKNPQNQDIPFIRVSEIGSDWGRIEFGQKKNGYYQIKAWDRGLYSDFNKCDISTYSWLDGEYKKTSCKKVDLKTWGK